MRSRSDGLTPAGDLPRAAARIARAVARHPGPVRVVIDGRSGSGKSTLAALVAERVPTALVVPLDGCYPGWDGLARGSRYALERVLRPHAEGRDGSWRRWRWDVGGFGRIEIVPAGVTLVVEGAGALTPASAALAQVRVWLDCPDDLRRTRALARDGDTYRPYWDRWAAQERIHLRRHRPRALATQRYRVG